MFVPSAAAKRLVVGLHLERTAFPVACLIVMAWVASGFGHSLRPAGPTSVPTISADFANRNNRTRRIPAGGFGINLAALQDRTILTDLTQAGITENRKMAAIPEVYATTTPDWRAFDSNMKLEKSVGLHPLIVLAYSPPWLQPTQGPCAGVPTVPPTDIAQWAQITASYVAHLDQAFPGLVHDYEIWNEPELQKSFCVPDGQNATRLAVYLSIYAAAASAMRAQAAVDGVKIRIGGPAIAVLSLAPQWIPALLSNSGTAPNVDFVSYHMYITGLRQLQQGMDWNKLYSVTQSSTKGELFYHLNIESLVRHGQQHDPWSTPIYLTEFNDNWVPQLDCCRNDPSFAPLWNTVYVSNLLNSIYVGAKHVPARVYYFAGSAGPFCIAGTWDTAMDCDPKSLQPYPQFYAFQLLAASGYLGLSAGGYMAASVAPGSTQSGLMATAFYTSAKDAIVVVNPTNTAYPSVQVTANHSGIANAVGTQFLLNQANPQITSQSLPLTQISGGYTATISVPAYSIVAITIAP